jgi:DNA-binding transcriptional LysR family regulator
VGRELHPSICSAHAFKYKLQIALSKDRFCFMDSRFLETFALVIDSGSIAETARRLNITAAGVAQRIHALETEIGTRLIVRSGQRVRPTEAGIAILERTRGVLEDIRDLKSAALYDQPSGQLRLGATGSSTSGILPDILALLIEKYPQIEVYIVSGNGGELYQRLLDGDVDTAIIPHPSFAIPKAYDWRTLREEPLVLLAPASMQGRHPHEILASEPLIRPRPNTWVGKMVDGYLRQARIRPRVRFELYKVEAMAVMVDRGLGVALMHDWAPPWPEGLSLLKLPLPDNPFGRRLGLIWNRASLRIRLVRALLEVATEALVENSRTIRKPTKSSERSSPTRRRHRSS